MGVAKYSDRDSSLLFPVSDSSTGYVLTGKATLGIGLNYADNTDGYGTDLGQKFVTYESWNDNDDNEYCKVINDAPNYTAGSGGWWFGNCRENLNGYYYKAAELNSTCSIPTAPWVHGSGIEFVTQNIAKPIVNGVSYTRTRMAIYRGTTQPTGLKNFCVSYLRSLKEISFTDTKPFLKNSTIARIQ